MSDARGITKTIDLEVIDNIFGSIVLGISGTTWTFGGYRDIAKKPYRAISRASRFAEGG